jgi:hypothetical protein
METEGITTVQAWTSSLDALGGFLGEHDAEGDGGGVEGVGNPAHYPTHAGDALGGVLGRHGQRRRCHQRDDELQANGAQRILGQLPDELGEILAV